MTKRTNGEGSIYRRESDGRYVGAVTRDGKRRVVYGRTRKEVVAKLRDVQQRADAGRPLSDDRRTVGTFIAAYLSDYLPGRVSASTCATYGALLRTHVVPVIGDVRLDRLTAADVLRVVNTARDSRSPRTAQAAYTTLRAALAVAVRWQLVARNVAMDVDRPTARPARVEAFAADEARRLLAAAHESREYALWAFLLGTGVRRGEALALRWEDVSLDDGTAQIGHSLSRVGGQLVRGATKTDHSTRTLYLAPGIVEALRAHRREQARTRLASQVWSETGYVFTTSVGTPLEPRNVNRSFSALCGRAQVPVRGVHALRHTFATLALDAGVSLAVISDCLGHSSIRVTSDVYAHVTPRATRDAAATMAGVLAL